MVTTTAQLIALACYFNGRARGLSVDRFYPANSTCLFCEYIRFVRRPEAAIDADDWLAREARPGRRAVLAHYPSGRTDVADRVLAGMVGGGGRLILFVASDGLMEGWEAGWQTGNREALDRRIWRVQYHSVLQNVKASPPKPRSPEAVAEDLRLALGDLQEFCLRPGLENFGLCFRRADDCLSSSDPFALVYHKDLAPDGLLGLRAKQLLAACQTGWVFGGMGSWNDLSFEGEDQKRYDVISERLFRLLNEAFCVCVNFAE